MQKRVRIGIGDPVVANRFLLWTIAGACGTLMMLTAVPPVVYPTTRKWMMLLDMLAFSVFGIGFCIAYSLVFFPPASHGRWIESRAAAATR